MFVFFFSLNFQEEENEKEIIKITISIDRVVYGVMCAQLHSFFFLSIFFLFHCENEAMLPSFDRCIDETQEKKHLDCSSLYGY